MKMDRGPWNGVHDLDINSVRNITWKLMPLTDELIPKNNDPDKWLSGDPISPEIKGEDFCRANFEWAILSKPKTIYKNS